jgi:hypothetical protein
MNTMQMFLNFLYFRNNVKFPEGSVDDILLEVERKVKNDEELA